jgi:hypothetical protein
MKLSVPLVVFALLAWTSTGCSPKHESNATVPAQNSSGEPVHTDEQIAQMREDTVKLNAALERAVAKGKLEGEDRDQVISYLRGPGRDQWELGGATLVSFARVSPQNAKDALELFKREVPKRAYEESPVVVHTLKRLEELAAAKPSSP